MISCLTSGTRVEVNGGLRSVMMTSGLNRRVMISCLTSGTRVEVNMCASEG